MSDRERQGTYRAGGVCLIAAGSLFLAGADLSMTIGAAPGGEAYWKSLTARANVAFANFVVFAATDVLLMPGVLALFLALRKTARWSLPLGVGLPALYCIPDLALTETTSLGLVVLARQYARAGGLQRALSAAVAFPLAILPVATFFSYFVSSLGLLIVSAVMLRGAFPKPAAYAGIVASVEGIVGGSYVFLPVLVVLHVPSLIAFAAWCALTGLRLVRLGTAGTMATAA